MANFRKLVSTSTAPGSALRLIGTLAASTTRLNFTTWIQTTDLSASNNSNTILASDTGKFQVYTATTPRVDKFRARQDGSASNAGVYASAGTVVWQHLLVRAGLAGPDYIEIWVDGVLVETVSGGGSMDNEVLSALKWSLFGDDSTGAETDDGYIGEMFDPVLIEGDISIADVHIASGEWAPLSATAEANTLFRLTGEDENDPGKDFSGNNNHFNVENGGITLSDQDLPPGANPAGSGTTISGTIFEDPEEFPAGQVSAGVLTLSGTTFEDPEEFPAGSISSSATFSGTTFEDPEEFPAGQVSAGVLTLSGTTFEDPEEFPAGQVSAGVLTLSGTTFEDPEEFPAGSITAGSTISGTTFEDPEEFPAGQVSAGVLTLSGTTFEDPEEFPAGQVSAGVLTLSGTTFEDPEEFPAGDLAEPGGVTPLWTRPEGGPGSAEFEAGLDSGWTLEVGNYTGWSNYTANTGEFVATLGSGDSGDPGTAAGGAGKDAPRLVTNVADGDIVLDYRVDTAYALANADYAGTYFYVEAADGTSARIDTYWEGGTTEATSYLKWDNFTQTGVAPKNPMNNFTDSRGYPGYFRLTRSGDLWTYAASYDGQNYVTIHSWTWAINLAKAGVGFYQINPGLTDNIVRFPYIHLDQTAPISVADDGQGRTTVYTEDFDALDPAFIDASEGGASVVFDGTKMVLDITAADNSTARFLTTADYGDAGILLRMRTTATTNIQSFFCVGLRQRDPLAQGYIQPFGTPLGYINEANAQDPRVRLVSSQGVGGYSGTLFDGIYAFHTDSDVPEWDPSGATHMWVRTEKFGPVFRVKFWADGDTEPAAWSQTVFDNTIPDAGKLGLILAGNRTKGAATTTEVDHFEVYTIEAQAAQQLLPLNTPVFVEGDSNTAFGYHKLNWSKVALMLSGPRVWLPPGAHLANAGSTVAHSLSSNSMVDRQPTMEALLGDHPGKKIVMWMIGTNAEAGQGTSYAATSELETYLTALKAVDPGNVITVCVLPAYNTDGGNSTRIDAQETWARQSSVVDYVLDSKEIVPAIGNMGNPNTHLDSGQHFAIGQEVSDLLATMVDPGTPYDVYSTPFYEGTLSGFTSKTGTGYSGNFPANWTPARTNGDGSVVGSETTIDSRSALQLDITAGASDTTIRVRRTITQSLSAGTILDAHARVGISASSDQTVQFLSINAGNGPFPNNLVGNLELDRDDWAGPHVYRSYVEPLPSSVSDTNFDLWITVSAGETATITFQDPVIAEAGTTADVAPAALTAPVMDVLTAGGTPSHTPGTYSGAPTPTVSYSYYVDGEAVADSYVLTEGESVEVLETALNTAGSANQTSAAVVVQAAGGAAATLDTNYAGDPAELVYSEQDTRVQATASIGGMRNTIGVDALTGKRYFEVVTTADIQFVGVGTSAVTLFSAGGNGVGRSGKAGGLLYFSDGAGGGDNTFVGDAHVDTDVLCVAVDVDAKLLWIRRNNGNWNGSLNGDPAAGTGGVTISDMTAPLYAYIQTKASTAADATLQGTESSFGYTAPTGFLPIVSGGGTTFSGTTFEDPEEFPAGQVSAGVLTLTGTTFEDPEEFPAGQVSAGVLTLTGTTFEDPEEFPAGSITGGTTISGTTFEDPEEFPAGQVSAGVLTLTGTTFEDPEEFPAGTFSNVVNLDGTIYVDPEEFPAGQISAGVLTLTGTTFEDPDEFPAGLVSTDGTILFGATFEDPDEFPAGQVSAGAVTLGGTTYVDPEEFPAGTFSNVVNLDGTTYVDPEEFPAGQVSAGVLILSGTTFEDPEEFPAGTFSNVVNLDGTTFEDPDEFPAGIITSGVILVGTIFEDPDEFPAGQFSAGAVVFLGSTFEDPDEFPSGIAGYEALGTLKVRVAGEWVEKPVKVYLSGEWVSKPIKKYVGEIWKDAS